jgi:ABC-type nitrate/sulfonate/bicarbonate transport system substrate-binding protein
MTGRGSRRRGSAGAALFAAIILAMPAVAGAQAVRKFQVTIPTPSVLFYPLYYAEDTGLFARQGLSVEMVATNGDGPDVDAVISGAVPFAVSTSNRLFTAFEQGRSLKAIGMLANRMAIECAMNRQVADRLGVTAAMPIEARVTYLKGLTVAGTRPGAFTYLLLQIYGNRAGLVPQKDYKLIGIGGINSMLPALENNQIAVGCTGSPFIELAESRGRSTRFTSNSQGRDPAFDDFLFEMVYARPDLLTQDPGLARGFLRALFQGVNEILDSAPEAHLAAIRARFGGVPDEVLLQSFANTIAVFSRDGIVTPASVEKAGRFMVESGTVKRAATFADVADNGFLPKP